MSSRRFLGVFVHPVDVQCEGLTPVFDNLARAGVTAISMDPRLACPAANGGGVRFPDLHVDGYRRVLARPLWGQYELMLDFYLAYTPDFALYGDGPYRPRAKTPPPDLDPGLPSAMIKEARRRGMEAHIQIQPFLPPGLRPEDGRVFVDGSRPAGKQVARQACINNEAVRAYAFALIKDTLRHYPDVDGLFMDWVEFASYQLEDHFSCFCPACQAEAEQAGFVWEAMRRDVSALWVWAHALTAQRLEQSRRVAHQPSELLGLLTRYPGWLEFLRFKAHSVSRFYRETRQLMDSLGLAQITLSARGWPPPWNRSSGMDYGCLADVCAAVTPKLFTFDYSVLPRWYGQTLLAWNTGLSESQVLDALVDWMALPDDIERRSFAHYQIPGPEEPHPAKIEAYRPRIDEVAAQVAGRARVYPFAHAYLPEPQWKHMLALLRDSPADGAWVQMYGYLSETKLRILEQVWQ